MSTSGTVNVVTTQEEREALYRFRYEIYVEELKRDYPDADHERKWLRDKDDEQDYAVNLYVGPLERIVGALRLLIWPAGETPEDYHRMFSMEVFPGLEDLVTAEMGRLMVRPTSRGGAIFPSLISAMYEHLVARGVEFCFLYCVPGLVKHYRKTIGARPYGGRLIPAGSSVGVPLAIVVSDSDHFAESGAIFSAFSKKHFDTAGRAKLELSRFMHILEGESVPVRLDEAAVWGEFQGQLLEGESSVPAFLSSLSPTAIRMLTSSGFILDLSPGDVIAKSGTEEREVYVILNGVFEVCSQ